MIKSRNDVLNVLPLNDFYKTSGDRGDMSEFEESLTRQEFADECDINTIMLRYEQAGAITHVNKALPVYMDVTAVPDLRGALDVMAQATEAFKSLPARVRREFDNDPQKFVDYAQDPANLEQMRTWGLAPQPDSPPAPIKVEVTNPAVDPPKS